MQIKDDDFVASVLQNWRGHIQCIAARAVAPEHIEVVEERGAFGEGDRAVIALRRGSRNAAGRVREMLPESE